MAGLANGVATVTTSGPLTEPVWADTRAVALAPASDAHAFGASTAALLRDPGERSALACRGRTVYDARFAIDRTLDILLQPVLSVAQ
jgi:hypothetical protein